MTAEVEGSPIPTAYWMMRVKCWMMQVEDSLK